MKTLFVSLSMIFAMTFGHPPAQGQPVSSSRTLPMLKDGAPLAYVVFSRPKQTRGLAMINPAGITYETEVAQGRLGVKPANDSAEKCLYFQTAVDQITLATGTFFVSVNYMDRGQGAIEIEYVYLDDNNQKQLRKDRMFLGGSNDWQIHTFTLAGAVLDQSLADQADFRLCCPGVLIHAVGISRFPIANPDFNVSPVYRQPTVRVPPGYSVGVIPEGISDEEWRQPALFNKRSTLYQSWGVQYLVDTIDGDSIAITRGSLDFSVYAQRAELLQRYNIAWVPRFRIGDLGSIPAGFQHDVQKAVGAERPTGGPMISMWEPRLAALYGEQFRELNRSLLSRPVPQIVLSFAGDWGPFLFSADSNGRAGWPDFWAGDSLAIADFRNFLQSRYGNPGRIRSIWNEEVRSLNEVFPSIASGYSNRRMLDTFEWYRTSLLKQIRAVIEQARRYFTQSEIVIEIADDFRFGATDIRTIAALASELSASVVLVSKESAPTMSSNWLLLAGTCNLYRVKFGLRVVETNSQSGMISPIYSLASEGGTLLYVNENLFAVENAWEEYVKSISQLRNTQPNPQVAVVYPYTSATIFTSQQFDRIVYELRDYFGFDIIDERDLSRLNSQAYPLVIVPWGRIWSDEALRQFDRIARDGSALLVHSDGPWQNVDGAMDINERLFAVKLEQRNGEWVLTPKRDQEIYSGRDPYEQVTHKTLKLGESGDDAFLSGLWSPPQNKASASQYGFPFDSFRWLGERGGIVLPMKPGIDYTLEIEGFVPEGKYVQVFINKQRMGAIRGQGLTLWTMNLAGRNRHRSGNLEILLRGELWNTGNILGATQANRVSMAVHQISAKPVGSQNETDMTQPLTPQFQQKDLRGSMRRELGRGVTLIATPQQINEWMFRELVNAIVYQPTLIAPQYRFELPPDGEKNRIFVKPQRGVSVYLNLWDYDSQVSYPHRSGLTRTIPKRSILYTN